MNNSNQPENYELPSSVQLLKSTVVALVIAMVLLLVIVMPAEYGIDPTGMGEVTGLRRMGEIKMLLAEEAAQEEEAILNALNQSAPNPQLTQPTVSATPEPVATIAESDTASGVRSDVMVVALAPDAATEVKVTLAKGKTVEYSWQVNQGLVNYDTHGDSEALDISYFSYGKGTNSADSGIVEAAFDGNHGWYWRNRTGAEVRVTLTTRGEYTNIQQLH